MKRFQFGLQEILLFPLVAVLVVMNFRPTVGIGFNCLRSYEYFLYGWPFSCANISAHHFDGVHLAPLAGNLATAVLILIAFSLLMDRIGRTLRSEPDSPGQP